ncbi:MAG: hypothetical protein NC489_17250 [Ruminococcus flavefaciens]|nr:hypothetical protein [Ruminococcus flavefaciens]
MADYVKLKRTAKKFYDRQKWELSLRTVFYAAGFMYTMNQIQCDRELEALVYAAADRLLSPCVTKDKPSPDYVAADEPSSNGTDTDNVVVYYDGFGQISRGMTYIYLKALTQLGCRVEYVTYEANRRVHSSAVQLVGEENVYYIVGGSFGAQMKDLQRILIDSRAGIAFLYMKPDDVVALGVFSHCPAGLKRYLINLTDHAFWLGTGIADEVINFREFGVKICIEKRGLDPGKLQYLPYYPERPEAGRGGTPGLNILPFPDESRPLIFSGGTLSKTESPDNGYYRLIERILDTYQQANFLYLGNGDSRKLRRLQKKYPDRAAYAAERKDFFEIMERCTLYLSTYPCNGGLMTQYALLAHKIPVTWNHPGIEPELSIRHEESFWNYSTQEECLAEIGKLLTDDDYRHKKEQKLEGFLIDEDEFKQELQHILLTGRSIRTIGNRPAIFKGFQELPPETIQGLGYDRLFFRRNGWYLFRFFPVKFSLGMLAAIFQKTRCLAQSPSPPTAKRK